MVDVDLSTWRALYHTQRWGACGGLALYLDPTLLPGERITAQRVRLVDGTQPRTGDRVVCGFCHRRLPPEWLMCLEQRSEEAP